MERAFPMLVAVLVVATTSAVSLGGDDCYRPVECDGEQSCIDLVCVDSEEPLTECEIEDGCTGSHMVCHDGYCKRDAVYCYNEAGHCYVGNGWIGRSCADGHSMEGEGEEVTPAPTNEELYQECLTSLVSGCGEEAPDITKECTEEQLSKCQGLYDKIVVLQAECGEEVEEVGFAKLKFCCRSVKHKDEGHAQTMDCVENLSLSQCDQLEDCYQDPGQSKGGSDMDKGVDAGSGADRDNTNAAAEGGSDSDSGCSVTGALGAPRNISIFFTMLMWG
jgi:hypothetical protein